VHGWIVLDAIARGNLKAIDAAIVQPSSKSL
jgi:hypothetical protein